LIEKGNEWKDICGYQIVLNDLFPNKNVSDLVLDEIPQYMSIVKEDVKYSKLASIYSHLQRKFWVNKKINIGCRVSLSIFN
jgi:hypothetical protein